MFPKKIYFKKKIRQSKSYKSNNYEYNKNRKPINFFHLFSLFCHFRLCSGCLFSAGLSAASSAGGGIYPADASVTPPR